MLNTPKGCQRSLVYQHSWRVPPKNSGSADFEDAWCHHHLFGDFGSCKNDYSDATAPGWHTKSQPLAIPFWQTSLSFCWVMLHCFKAEVAGLFHLHDHNSKSCCGHLHYSHRCRCCVCHCKIPSPGWKRGLSIKGYSTVPNAATSPCPSRWIHHGQWWSWSNGTVFVHCAWKDQSCHKS